VSEPLPPSQFAEPVSPAPAVRRAALPLPKQRVVCTFVFLAINVLLFLVMTVFGWTKGLGLRGSENGLVLLLFGAKFGPAVSAGQYWRLLTACFLHIGVLHLLFNSWMLFSLGQQMEQLYGAVRFSALYLLAGVAGNTLSYVGNDSLSAGASGAIFGLIGAAIAYFVTYREEFGGWGQRQLRNMVIVAGYNLVIGFTSGGIDNLGHIGGLLAGLALGWGYCPRYRVVEPSALGAPLALVDAFPRRRALLATVGVVLVIVALVVIGKLSN
jgi:rhomboid protease GluP